VKQTSHKRPGFCGEKQPGLCIPVLLSPVWLSCVGAIAIAPTPRWWPPTRLAARLAARLAVRRRKAISLMKRSSFLRYPRNLLLHPRSPLCEL